ncbi:MAG: hypothetical protein GXP41_06920 [Chloroflexi bacterium]|nr:hypothetical protein [Chloroflexota bacterium]
MVRKLWQVTLVILIGLFLTGINVAAFVPGDSTITVNSTADDYHDGKSKKCSAYPTEPCTLRRAINQAYSLSSSNRPVTIQFDIPTTDSGYDSGLGVWKIRLTGSTLYDLRELYGKTIIDGSTQPGGRSNGPKIIIDGQGNKNNGFILRQGNNVVRGLAMQDFKNSHITISSDDNTIENCWFGLSDDGTTLSSGSDTDPEGGSGVVLSAGSDRNTVRDNVFAGFFETAAAIRGDDNIFAGNRIGMRADGTVPIPHRFAKHPCLSGAWTGGSGITVADSNNQIGGATAADGNIFAGLFLDVGPTTTQCPAMDVSGDEHVIQNNIIGLDINDKVVGVCGRGLDLGSEPSDMQVLDNVIVEPSLSAILMNGVMLNGNTLRGNAIRRETAWPGKLGHNKFAEGAIVYGPVVPAALKNFVPAKITMMSGTSVSGTSGNGSPCPFCTIEIFLDDADGITEALRSLVTATANGSGGWQATLPAPLASGQGLRTMSTVPDNFTINGLHTGTTSNLSLLQGIVRQNFLPLVQQ